jgi:hypothetical protein
MHHSSSPYPESQLNLGATGKFPEGKLNSEDEGELSFAVGLQGKKIVVDFGKPVAWVGMDATQADDLASLLQDKARKCRGEGETKLERTERYLKAAVQALKSYQYGNASPSLAEEIVSGIEGNTLGTGR